MEEKKYSILLNKKREFKTEKELKEILRQNCNDSTDDPLSENELEEYTKLLVYLLGQEEQSAS